MGRKKKQKLWGTIDAVLERRETKFGDKFLIALVGVDDKLWVQQKDLSTAVAECFKMGIPLPKKAKALVNRGFVEKQKKYVTQLLIKDLRSGSSTSQSLKKSQTLDPLKVARRHARWITTVQSYVVGINKILSCVTAKRATELKQLIVDLNPPLFCLSSLVITRFLDGSYQIWNAKDTILQNVENKLGFLRCTVCEKDFKWSSQERTIKHILSTDHHKCCKLKNDAADRARSVQVLQEASSSALDGAETIKLIQDYAAQYCASKSLPFTAAVMALDCVSVAIATIVRAPISQTVIADLQSNGHKSEARTMRQLQYMSTLTDVGGKRKAGAEHDSSAHKRSRVRQHRTTISKKIGKFGNSVISLKTEYYEHCPYVGVILDEGNNWKRSCPVYAGTITCDLQFRWRIQFVGQRDCSGSKTGESIWKFFKEIFIDHGWIKVYKKIFAAGTDGASVMRSTIHFRGLDCKGLLGRSFAAFLKRDVKDDLDFWHCLCHVFNLGLNDALDAITALKLFFIPHLRMMHSEFKRSSNNRAELKSIHADLKDFDNTFDWKIFYPQVFCLTRWIGVYMCTDILSRKSNRVMMKRYAQRLRRRGFGPRTFDPFKYRKRRRLREAADVDVDSDDDEVDSDEENEIREIQTAIEEGRLDADGYQPQRQLFASARQAAASAPTQDELVAADDFDEGDVDAKGRKCKNLLNPNVGLTDLNCGRSAYLTGVLKPYKVLIESLQGIQQPEQHLAARRIRKWYMIMESSWVGTAEQEPMYACRNFREWVSDMEEIHKFDLVKLVKRECRAFAGVLVASIKERLAKTWPYIQALELIDPLGPALDRYATTDVWTAFRDLCSRRGIDCDLCQEQILEIRAEANDLTDADKTLIKTNLCAYLRKRHKTFVDSLTPSKTRAYDLFCIAVFSIPLTSSFIESLFSKMTYNQHKIRNRLADSTMSSILHVHDAVLPDPQKGLTGAIRLRAMEPRKIDDRLHMNKHIGVRVCEVFEGDRYHGEVTDVRFHDIHAQYMYHVVYSDGDECDYWRYELEVIRCRCCVVSDE